MMDDIPQPVKILGLIAALFALCILSLGISLNAGAPVESGDPPLAETAATDHAIQQVEWTPEADPDVTVSLNSTIAWESTWVFNKWFHPCVLSGSASAHADHQDSRVITGQRTEIRVNTPNRGLSINPYYKEAEYFGGRSDPERGMVIRETTEKDPRSVKWEWTFTKLGATVTSASHYARWDLTIPQNRFCQVTVTDAIDTIHGEEIAQRWNMTIDPLPDPKELSNEELARYGIRQESWGQYFATGAVHLTPERKK